MRSGGARRRALKAAGLLVAASLFGKPAWTTCTAADTAVTAVNPDDPSALAAECSALLAVKDTLRGTAALNWASTVSMGSWDGIFLRTGNSNVAQIHLPSAGLTGTIPDLSALTSVSTVNLSGNELTGEIPSGFPASVTNLTLAANRLTGGIPDLSSLTSLTYLRLSANELSGSIPATLSALNSLQLLEIWDNRLDGNITSGTFPASLETLRLARNGLTGSIPEFSGFTSLTSLDLRENEFSGSIPDLSGLTSLAWLDLGGNDLTGSVIAARLPASLEHLHLDKNELTGSLPDLSALTSLIVLYLPENELTGSLPDLSALTSLRRIALSDNRLTGSIGAASLPASLERLELDRNRLTGSLPDLSALTSLQRVHLYSNELSGSIPDLSGLTNLERLWLSDNRLTGSIPASLGGLTSLRLLYLNRNRLSGAIPDLSGLTNLDRLRLSGNQLTGSIPASLGGLTSLRFLYLNENQLSGAIPDLSGLTNLLQLRLSVNQLTGSIPATLGELTSLIELHLAVNGLTGEIPAKLGDLTNLNWLSLCHNDLDVTATLPAALEARRTANFPTLWVFSCAGIESAAATEGQALRFRVEHSTFPVRGAAGAADLTLSWETKDGTAASPADYTGTVEGSPGSVTIPGNSDTSTSTSAATVEVPTVLDGVAEGDETLTVRLFAPSSNRVFVAPAVATGTITNADPPPPPPPLERPTASFSSPSASAGEASGIRNVTLNLSSAASADLAVHYTLSGTATRGADYGISGVTSGAGTVTVAFGAARAIIPVAITDDRAAESDETVVLTLKPGAGYVVGGTNVHTLTIIDDDGDECESRVAPYWRGTGGFAVRPTDGRSAVVRLQCGGYAFLGREHAGDDGLIVRTVGGSRCLSRDGRPIQGELTFEGIDADGWYWINGDWNVALSPLVCKSSLRSGWRPPVPDGVAASPSGDQLFLLLVTGRYFGTLMVHDRTGFIGLVPHLVDMEGNGEHVAPYWMGHGGVVGRPLDGRAATFRLSCEDGRRKSYTLEAGEDGVIVSLLSGCFDGDGEPIGGELRADGLEDGAWYWINSGRLFTGEKVDPMRQRCRPGACSTAAPFVRGDSVPDTLLSVPVVPGGVEAEQEPRGTFFSQGSLIGIVPRIETVYEGAGNPASWPRLPSPGAGVP